jgi:hypothetical protein
MCYRRLILLNPKKVFASADLAALGKASDRPKGHEATLKKQEPRALVRTRCAYKNKKSPHITFEDFLKKACLPQRHEALRLASTA